MTKWFRLSILIGLSMAPLSAQSPVVAPPHPSWMTDSMVFEFLFKHVMFLESSANQLVAMGKDDSALRHHFKNMARLTDQEEALLKSTASDAVSGLTAWGASSSQVLKGLQAQYPTRASLPAPGLQQLQSLDSQKQQLVQNHMATLQAGMPAGDYQKFYNFAWGSEGAHIERAQPGAKPPAGIQKPAPGLQQPAAGIQQAPKP